MIHVAALRCSCVRDQVRLQNEANLAGVAKKVRAWLCVIASRGRYVALGLTLRAVFRRSTVVAQCHLCACVCFMPRVLFLIPCFASRACACPGTTISFVEVQLSFARRACLADCTQPSRARTARMCGTYLTWHCAYVLWRRYKGMLPSLMRELSYAAGVNNRSDKETKHCLTRAVPTLHVTCTPMAHVIP